MLQRVNEASNNYIRSVECINLQSGQTELTFLAKKSTVIGVVGIVDGKRGRAQTIQLRSLVAKDVPIVVHAGGAYGDGIDGLLGMSFLSRFNINMDGKTVRISPRTAR